MNPENVGILKENEYLRNQLADFKKRQIQQTDSYRTDYAALKAQRDRAIELVAKYMGPKDYGDDPIADWAELEAMK